MKPDSEQSDASMASPSLRFLVVTAFDSRYEVGFLCSVVNEAYCQKHNYTFHRVLLNPSDMRSLAGGRHLAWGKVALLRDLLEGKTNEGPLKGWDGLSSAANFDYIIWIDADALVLDHSVQLEDFVEVAGGMDFIIGEDMAETDLLNTGLMFFKRSAWCQELLKRWWDESDPKWHSEVCWDQTGLCRLLSQDGFASLERVWYTWAGSPRYKSWQDHVFVVDCGSFNFKYLNNCGFVFHAVGERELLLSGTRNLLLKRDRLHLAVRDGFVAHGADLSSPGNFELLPAGEIKDAKQQLDRAMEFWRSFGLVGKKKLPPPFGWELSAWPSWQGKPVPSGFSQHLESPRRFPGASGFKMSPRSIGLNFGEVLVSLGREDLNGGSQVYETRLWQFCNYVLGQLPPFSPLQVTMMPSKMCPWRLLGWKPWETPVKLPEDLLNLASWRLEAGASENVVDTIMGASKCHA